MSGTSRIAGMYRSQRARRLAEDPSLAEHGKGATYRNWGCRCDPCTAANSADCAAWRRRARYRKPVT